MIPGSKLAVARGLRAETATSSLGQVLGVSGCDEDDLYAAMDWVHESAKRSSKTGFAARHLANGTLVLYDVSSAAFEGRTCPLGAIGHPRDGVKGRLQIVYGLLCSTAGIPVAIEVFEGNTADPNTLAAQITKIKTRFGLSRVCLVGDRGMLTHARIRDEVRPAQLDWISALRAPQIKALVEEGRAAAVAVRYPRPPRDRASRSFPASGWCAATTPPSPRSGPANARDLLAATEKELTPIAAATARAKRPLRGKDKIALRVGKVVNHYKMAKHSPRDHRRVLHLHPQHRGHRRRGRPRRDLRAAHQPARTHPHPARRGAALQEPRRCPSGSSAPSTANSTCGPSGIGWPTGCAPTCSCACCPTTSAGT